MPSADDSFLRIKLQKSSHDSKNVTPGTEQAPLQKSRLVYIEAHVAKFASFLICLLDTATNYWAS